jgi:L-fuconolactonase
MPSFPIIDSHVHIYDPGAIDYGWMSSVPKLNHPHMPQDYDRLTQGVAVEAMVFVEVDASPDEHLKEAAWVSALAQREPRIKAIVGAIPLDKGVSVEADIAQLAAMPLARGVRQLIQNHLDEPGWCLREDFVSAIKLLPKYNLSFDLCLHHPQLADVIALVSQCPDVRFVVDHIAKPGIKAGLIEPWRTEFANLSRFENVSCKISGVVTEADHGSWTEAHVKPYISHAIDCFGIDRVMFGGDWPVSELATSYRRWVDLVDDVFADASADEQRKFFHNNAAAFYRIN